MTGAVRPQHELAEARAEVRSTSLTKEVSPGDPDTQDPLDLNEVRAEVARSREPVPQTELELRTHAEVRAEVRSGQAPIQDTPELNEDPDRLTRPEAWRWANTPGKPPAEVRVPPHNLDAEASLLGAMLLSSDAIAAAVQVVTVDDFYKPAHAHVYDAITSLHSRGEPADHVTVAEELKRAGLLEVVGGPGTLVDLESQTPATSNAAYYGGIVSERATMRKLVRIGAEVTQLGYDEPEDPDAAVDQAEALIAGVKAHRRPSTRTQITSGGSFILDQPDSPPAQWGSGCEVIWPAGEPLLVVGPIGVGKTTLLQRLALARIGVGHRSLLGHPVEPAAGPVLYLASDRPRQASRSFRRMVGPEDREKLDAGLVVWQGPPAADLAQHPRTLLEMIEQAGATEVYLDSLKDLAVGIANDEEGAGLNMAIQLAVAAGYEVAGAHHQRKRAQGATRPKGLDDVYGSTWITAGAGSVVLLWGEPGDTVLDLLHLKPPADPVGPLRVAIDVVNGAVSIDEEVDLVVLAGRADRGLTVEAAARALFDKPDPSRAEVEKTRRRLRRLVDAGDLEEIDGFATAGGTPPKLWRPASGVRS